MKKKRVSKKLLFIILGVMIISVCTLTIAYSVLSSTLIISGSTEVAGSSWNITVSKGDITAGMSEEQLESAKLNGLNYFSNGVTVGDAKLEKEPIISGTSISDFQISVTKPGEGVILCFDVTNNGSIPAKIDSIVKNTPSFSSSTNNPSDIELLSNNWFADIDISKSSGGGSIEEGSILCPGETIYWDFLLGFNEDATAVPNSKITISNLGGSLNLVQADLSACN